MIDDDTPDKPPELTLVPPPPPPPRKYRHRPGLHKPKTKKQEQYFKSKLKIITPDILRKCYLTWEWNTHSELVRAMQDEYGETVSAAYLSKVAVKNGWDALRGDVMNGETPHFLQNIWVLKREALSFKEIDFLTAVKQRILKRVAAEVVDNDSPEFFIGMMEFYHAVHRAITDSWQYKLQSTNPPSSPDPGPDPPKIDKGGPRQASVVAEIGPFSRRK